MANRQFYNLVENESAYDIYLYSDIWFCDDCSLAEEIKNLETDNINVYINSYGGDVRAGFGIYSALKHHKAKITTYCDGMACSIASVIFMAGDERIMGEHSLLMIHNPWTYTSGNAEELREQADLLDKMANSIRIAYLSGATISDEELKDMMDSESWMSADEAIEYGFATKIDEVEEGTEAVAKAKVLSAFFNAVKGKTIELKSDDATDDKSVDELQSRLDEFEAKLNEMQNNLEKLHFKNNGEPEPTEPSEPTEPEEPKTKTLFDYFRKEN